MNNQNKLDMMLKSSYNDLTIKLYFLKNLFQVAEYWNFSQSDKELLARNEILDDIGVYLNRINYLKQELDKWENLNNLEDLKTLKELLEILRYNLILKWKSSKINF